MASFMFISPGNASSIIAARQLEEAFRAAGWPVSEGWIIGPPRPFSLGLKSALHPKPEETAVILALNAIGITPTVYPQDRQSADVVIDPGAAAMPADKTGKPW